MNENFWSYRLQKLGTLQVLRMDGQTERRTLLQKDSCWLPIKRKYPTNPRKFNGINFILSLYCLGYICDGRRTIYLSTIFSTIFSAS